MIGVSPTLAAICFLIVLRLLMDGSLGLSMYPRTGDSFTNVNVECCLFCHVAKLSQKNYVAKKIFVRA